jgi:hypothetical protein
MRWERCADAADAADEILDLLGLDVALKASPASPLKPRGFETFIRTVLRSLRSAAMGPENAALRSALSILDAKWSTLTAEQRERVVRGSARAIAGASRFVAPRVDRFVSSAAAPAVRRVKEAARAAYGTKISGRLSTKLDERVVQFLRRSQANFVRDEFGRRSVRHAQVARDIVADGLARGWDNAAIGSVLDERLTALGVNQSVRYWEVVASVWTQRARSYGLVSSFAEAGITAYRWSSVMDERTCFAAGTRVRLGDGRTSPIESIRAGDFVTSCRGAARRVLATRAMPRRDWLRVETADGRRLDVTPNHPILTSCGWVRARDLDVGDDLVLFRGEGRGRAAELWDETALQGVRCVVRSDEVPESLLLDEVSRTGTDVRALRQHVPKAAPLRRSRSGSVLHDRVLESESARGRRTRESRQDMHPVRALVPRSTRGRVEDAIALLEDVSASNAGVSMLDLRRARGPKGERARGALLFALVLPASRRRDEPGDDRAAHARGSVGPLRAGSSRREVVDRLPDRGSRRARGRRDVLAFARASEAEGRAAGSRTGAPRADGHPVGGVRGEGGPDVRAEGAQCLWPRPRHDVAARADVVRVVRISAKLLKRAAPAYDIEVESDAGFVAEGVIVHNTEECRFMDGTLLTVDGALKNIERAERVSAQEPEAIKEAAPFMRSGKDDDGNRVLYVKQGGERVVVAQVDKAALGERDARGSYSREMRSTELEARGVSIPPIHELCRSTILPEI